MLANGWLDLLGKVVATRKTAQSPFQIEAAGVTRQFETIIREIGGEEESPRQASVPVAPKAVAEPASAEPDNLQATSQLLERMNNALQKLTSNTRRHGQNLVAALHEITEAAGESLNVERSSIWVFTENGAGLRCLDLYQRSLHLHESGAELAASAYPAYFASLANCRVIDAHVARKDPRTYEFAKDYLEPLNISSLIDAPVRRDGEAVGVICLEHVGPPRRWTTEELAFIGSLADLIALIVESNERQRAEAGLKYSHSLLNAAFNATADGMVIIDRDGFVSGFNQRFLDLWKVSADQIGKKKAADVLNLFASQVSDPASFTAKIGELFANPESETHEVIEFTDGRVYERTSKPQRLDNAIVGRVCSYRDVTEQRKSEKASESLEAMLRQTQKLESLGTLAGGIAHDFNNILTAVLGHAELALQQTTEPKVQQSLSEIFKASDRAKNLVKQILTFCRQRPPERKTQPLRPLLEEVTKLLRATIPASIEIKQEFDRGQSAACIDGPQIHQVLMNLCTNACHAMQQKGGVIRLGESVVDVSAAAAPNYPGLKPGRHAHLWVADTGCGMDAETMQRVFEPFFTTKAVGEGTGLGLSVVHGIIQSHDGCITVESEVGRGTTFHIYLPAVTSEAKTEEAFAPGESPHSRGERVLYVDDDPSVGQFVRQALEMLDYDVSVFTHPVEALEHFRTRSYDYDLVLTDMGMPRVNGLELSNRVQKIAPGIPIILMTGNDGGIPFPSLAKAGIRRVVTKPVSCRDLSIVIREVLDMNRTTVDDE